MPESDHPSRPDHLTVSVDLLKASDPTVAPAESQWTSDLLPDLEHDREVLS